MVDDLGLRVWFADDGDTDWNHRNLVKGHNTKPTAKISTQSFSKHECNLICQWFSDKYQLHPTVREKKSELSGNIGYVIKFNTEDTEGLHKVIDPHLIPSMKYKTNLRAYLKHSGREIPVAAKYTAKRCPLGHDFYKLSHHEREEWISGALYHLRRGEFPQPKVADKEKDGYLQKVLDFDSAILFSGGDIKYKNDNSSFILSFHPHFIHMNSKNSRSLQDLYNDDAVIRDVILYTISRESRPYGRAIIHGLRNYRGNKTIGTFPTYGAKAVYDSYCPAGARVLDFCAGFGNRLVGAWASENVASYTGIDACTPTVDALNKIKRRCQITRFKSMTVLLGDSKTLLEEYKDGSFDFIFTSPPYFDREHYSSDPAQSNVQYPEYGPWLTKWMLPCISQSLRLLSERGVLIINIADCSPYFIAKDVCQFIEKNGRPVKVRNLFIAQNKHEPLLIADPSVCDSEYEEMHYDSQGND